MAIDKEEEVAKLVHHRQSVKKKRNLVHHPRVGLVYDDRHFDTKDENPEKPDRIKAIWAKLESHGITKRCLVLKAKEADDRKITLVHKQKYTDSQRKKIASKFNDVYLNKGSSQSAYLAAGAVSEKIAKGELDSAVAIVRPPGHHAEVDKAMGFCIFNNVAIAASVLVNDKPELGISKILIVDWDVHHGNGTQKMFWQDPRVLVFNVHRHELGIFFPLGNDGSHSMIGEGPGTGYNVNVPWEQGECGDADYFAVWDHVLIPIAKAFNPDMILISGGFDAAAGDTMGACSVTPDGYSVMMKKLMPFARGKVMMALEGGYNLESLSKSVLACVEALLENKPIIGSSKAEASPLEYTWRVIEAVRKELSRYWPMLSDHELLNTIKRTSSSKVTESAQVVGSTQLMESGKITESAEEMELLRRQLTQSQNSIAAAELARDVAVKACELAEQARAAADTSCTRESAKVLVLQEQIAGLTKKVDDLNADVIKQTNLVSNISGLARANEIRAQKAEAEVQALKTQMTEMSENLVQDIHELGNAIEIIIQKEIGDVFGLEDATGPM
ncbi:hypothetical protein MKW92_025144 [Papaver armeniacum]|nr:hypothetical protein MKW92_025144 [Papaver armeniacum]